MCKTDSTGAITVYFGNRYEADSELSENPHRWCMLLSLNYDEKLTAQFITRVTYTLHNQFPRTYEITEAPFFLARVSASFFNITAQVYFKGKEEPVTVMHELCLSGDGKVKTIKLESLDMKEVMRGVEQLSDKIDIYKDDSKCFLHEDKRVPTSKMLKLPINAENRSIIGILPENKKNDFIENSMEVAHKCVTTTYKEGQGRSLRMPTHTTKPTLPVKTPHLEKISNMHRLNERRWSQTSQVLK